MPGYIMHLAAAKLAIDKLGICDFERIIKIYTGSVIADAMPRQEKCMSHFWTGDTMKYLKRTPDVDCFMEQYPRGINDELIAAYYAHLYMDKRFVDDYWGKYFEFYNDDMDIEEEYDAVTKVRIVDRDIWLDRCDFLSDENYYGDYTRLLPYIVHKYELGDIFGAENPQCFGDMIKGLDYSKISEYCGNYSETLLIKMFENVYNVARNGDNSYKNVPELKVFALEELEKLIIDTSEILKKMLSMC